MGNKKAAILATAIIGTSLALAIIIIAAYVVLPMWAASTLAIIGLWVGIYLGLRVDSEEQDNDQ